MIKVRQYPYIHPKGIACEYYMQKPPDSTHMFAG